MEKTRKTIHERMALIKSELGKTKIAKSGHNKFAGFKYHELQDFITHINELNVKHEVNDFVLIDEENKRCSITLTSWDNAEDSYTIVIPFREAQMLAKGGAPSMVDEIQRMGSTVTYNRRYLYMTAYNIQESDGVDSQEQSKPKAKANFKEGGFENALEAVRNGKTTADKIVSVYNVTAEQLQQLKEAK